jgi:hypothetical protein
MKRYKIAIGLRLLPEDHQKIAFVAQQNKRSLNAQIEFSVLETIRKHEKEHGKIILPKK